jgi:AP-3 complex subunit delta-1
LYLIQPLFSGYELNPVATNAQASVPVPEGLDLDAWIVPPPREVVQVKADEGDDDHEKKAKKSKKGKGKNVESTAIGKKRKTKENGNQVLLLPIESDTETLEEKMLREKVHITLLIEDRSY